MTGDAELVEGNNWNDTFGEFAGGKAIAISVRF